MHRQIYQSHGSYGICRRAGVLGLSKILKRDRQGFGCLHILVAAFLVEKHKLLEKQTASWWYLLPSKRTFSVKIMVGIWHLLSKCSPFWGHVHVPAGTRKDFGQKCRRWIKHQSVSRSWRSLDARNMPWTGSKDSGWRGLSITAALFPKVCYLASDDGRWRQVLFFLKKFDEERERESYIITSDRFHPGWLGNLVRDEKLPTYILRT